MKKHTNKKKLNLTISIVFLLFIVLFFFSYQNEPNKTNQTANQTNTTQEKQLETQTLKEIIVNGNSMEPVLKSGQTIKYTEDFNEIKREDIIIYNYSANNNLIVKRVKAIPNDTFKYENNIIYINEKELKNSQGETYKINSKMLNLYAKSYPTLPENTYLILGEQVGGTLDSSKFGLVDKSDIIGLVIE